MPRNYEKIHFQYLIIFVIHLTVAEPDEEDIEEIDEELFEMLEEAVLEEFDEFLQTNRLTRFNDLKEFVYTFELFAKLKYQIYNQQ